ncbi:MAG TPA: hypothetical protein VM285_02005, partial [Polyangia bacterium]|nr:hypothetical protein [Polyangia bacterium]
GVPLVLAEARACGCRVVCTDLPGVRERIAPTLGGSLSLVPLPRMMRVDEPNPGALPAFVDDLETALSRALDAGPVPPCGEALAPLSWKAVFARVERIWLALAAFLCLALVAPACAPSPPPPPATTAITEAADTGDAALGALLADVRERAPAGFRVAVAPPFVVAGDGPAESFPRRVAIVDWAVTHLERSFFERRPAHPIEIWLFDGAESYRRHALTLFDEEPHTPYGWYSPEHRALLMDIATGGGTLVHEIVHPYVEADFPGCPPWINEGLGSLFEQSAEADGRIVGLTNWRLPGFQDAIRQGGSPPLGELFAADAATFYGADPGTNYAQARYLLYHLQERDLLERFYRETRAAAATDPTGEATLLRILGETDLPAFQRRHEEWVLGLAFSP